jgi:RimJ/RimL family protein N-acetyltransferase
LSFRLATGRLVLRSWRKGDAQAFEQACNTPAVSRYVGGLQSAEQIDTMIRRIQQCEADNGFCFWVLERRTDGVFLGFCGLKRLSADGAPTEILGAPEIGWRLRQDAWGRGYAKEAATAALDLAFGEFALSRVCAITLAENAASWGLMRRLGMTERPDLAFDMPRYGRHVVYELGRDTWTA